MTLFGLSNQGRCPPEGGHLPWLLRARRPAQPRHARKALVYFLDTLPALWYVPLPWDRDKARGQEPWGGHPKSATRGHQRQAARSQTGETPAPGRRSAEGARGRDPRPPDAPTAPQSPQEPPEPPGEPREAREGDRHPEGHHRATRRATKPPGPHKARSGHRDGRAARTGANAHGRFGIMGGRSTPGPHTADCRQRRRGAGRAAANPSPLAGGAAPRPGAGADQRERPPKGLGPRTGRAPARQRRRHQPTRRGHVAVHCHVGAGAHARKSAWLSDHQAVRAWISLGSSAGPAPRPLWCGTAIAKRLRRIADASDLRCVTWAMSAA